MANNLQQLLTHTTKKGLLQNIEVSDEDERLLRQSANEIKKALKQGIKKYNDGRRASERLQTPLFVVQGSYAYRTLNDVEHPGQQIDIDLGMYLPFSDLGDGQRQRLAVVEYHELVNTILGEYINENPDLNWSMP